MRTPVRSREPVQVFYRGDHVIDCFAGSGTTLEAACLEGFDVIGIDREHDYFEIAAARLAASRPKRDPVTSL